MRIHSLRIPVKAASVSGAISSALGNGNADAARSATAHVEHSGSTGPDCPIGTDGSRRHWKRLPTSTVHQRLHEFRYRFAPLQLLVQIPPFLRQPSQNLTDVEEVLGLLG